MINENLSKTRFPHELTVTGKNTFLIDCKVKKEVKKPSKSRYEDEFNDVENHKT